MYIKSFECHKDYFLYDVLYKNNNNTHYVLCNNALYLM